MSSATKISQPRSALPQSLFGTTSRPRPTSSASPPQSRVRRVAGFTVATPNYRDLYKNLTKQIALIERPKLEEGEEINVEIADFQVVSSYSWDDQKEPRILVPGSPRIWHDQELPFKLSKDEGKVFIDQNGSRLSTSPLLPLIIAVKEHNPSFRMAKMDFITDRNGLRKLYRWASQSSLMKSGLGRTFRIDVELVGKTILLQRWEVESSQPGGPGYEMNFQKRTTSQIPGCETATGHHRIVSFKFGDKRILMRYTTDACLPADKDDSLDEILYKLASIDLHKTPKTKKIATFKGSFLSVQTVGTLVPQESVIELKTRGHLGMPPKYDDLYVQLLFAGISNVYTGRHHMGEFYSVEKTTLESIKEEAGETVEDSLKLLKKVLDEIQRITLENLEDGGSLSLVLRKGDRGLEVMKREGRDGLLPENILAFIH